MAPEFQRLGGEGRIGPLVTAQQGEVLGHLEDLAGGQHGQRHAVALGFCRDDLAHILPLDGADGTAAGLDDSGFFSGNPAQVVAEELLVIVIDRADHGHGRSRDDVRGVIFPAKAHFQDEQVRRGFAEGEQSGSRGGLEMGDLTGAERGTHPFERIGKGAVADQFAGQAHPLIEAHKVRRGEDMHLQPGGFGHGAQEGAGRALSIGPGHMDDRGKAVVRIAEIFKQLLDPAEGELNILRVVALKRGERGGQPRCRVGQSAASFPAGLDRPSGSTSGAGAATFGTSRSPARRSFGIRW